MKDIDLFLNVGYQNKFIFKGGFYINSILNLRKIFFAFIIDWEIYVNRNIYFLFSCISPLKKKKKNFQNKYLSHQHWRYWSCKSNGVFTLKTPFKIQVRSSCNGLMDLCVFSLGHWNKSKYEHSVFFNISYCIIFLWLFL